MKSRSLVSQWFILVSVVAAQNTGSIDTATITDATGFIQTPSTVPAPTSVALQSTGLATTLENPVAVTAPGAQITTTDGAPTVTTDVLTTDIVMRDQEVLTMSDSRY